MCLGCESPVLIFGGLRLCAGEAPCTEGVPRQGRLALSQEHGWAHACIKASSEFSLHRAVRLVYQHRAGPLLEPSSLEDLLI